MAKKQKRQVSSGAPRSEAGPVYTPASVARRVIPAADFKPDYTHVVTDLKRIAVLAGSFFAILVVLSFILR